MVAYGELQKLRAGDKSPETRRAFETHKADLGYGLLLKKYTNDIATAGNDLVLKAANDTIPRVADQKRWLMRMAVWCIPLPWIAAESGWFVAEYGRQPWTI
jgi:cytochrome d ubiquinol oxidase subunit I